MGKLAENLKFRLWHQVHQLPQSWVLQWQKWQLAKIIRYAHKEVPMYRKLWKKAGFYPSVKNFSHAPVVTKNTILNFPPEKRHTAGKMAPYWHTSGSTGEPFEFIPSHLKSQDYYDSRGYRFLCWRGVSLKKAAKLRIVRIRMSPFSHPTRLFIPVSEFLEHSKKTIQDVIKFRPFIVESYPTILTEFASIMRNMPNNDRPQIPFIVSYGEMLTAYDRQFISDNLGGEVYDKYGLEELGEVGIECAKHDGFHLNNESFVLEITDGQGNPLPNGTKGHIIITDLNNFAMPFIRYDTCDLGVIFNDPCHCGLNTLRFSVEGRYGSLLKLPARKIHHFEFAEIFKNHSRIIRQYQIVKTPDFSFEIHFIPGPDFKEEAAIVNMVRPLVGETSFYIKRVNKISRLSSGKIQNIIEL